MAARSKSGGVLKHATGKMKIQYMNRYLDLKDQIANDATRIRLEELLQEERNLITDCVDIEGYESFWAWYDNDDNIPPHGSTRERIRLVGDRLFFLKQENKNDQVKPDTSG